MAFCSKYGGGKIDAFITVTATTKWREIQEQLQPGMNSQDRFDVVCRVFEMKLKAVEEDLYKKGIFGRCVAHLRVIEFQKRELPHAHILIILDERDRINTVEQVDSIVSSELPPHPTSILDEDEDKQRARRDQVKRLRDIVCKWMIHGPCGEEKPKAPCIYDNNGDLTKEEFPEATRRRNVY